MQNKFGGAWTQEKLSALQYYLESYTQALGKKFKLHYVDAFAGSGDYIPTAGGTTLPGSARIALEHGAFDRYTFFERGAAKAKRLERLLGEFPTLDATVHRGDANELIKQWAHAFPRKHRAVLFLDPFGMAVSWETLERVKWTGVTDVWYLYPLSAACRQLTRDPKKRDFHKDRSLDRIFGTPDWRTELYPIESRTDLFGPVQGDPVRCDIATVQQWITDRLRTLFPYVSDPLVLNIGRGSRGIVEAGPLLSQDLPVLPAKYDADRGPALYALYFMMANNSPGAIRLAKDLVNGVVKRVRRERAA